MDKQNFKYTRTEEEERLDAFVAGEMPEFSRGFLKDLIKQKCITVNGEVVKPSYILKLDDEIEITFPENKSSETTLKKLLIHEDKHLLVIRKPSGLLVHPLSPTWETTPEAAFAAEETLVSILLADKPKDMEEGLERVGMVQRLDKDTSGVMLFTKTKKMQDKLKELFANRKMDKTYNAILCGTPKDKQGIINVPIGRVAGGKIKASPVGREAITEYKIVQQKKGFAFAELYPKTGRTNQLRVHMAWLGYPVLGDWLYKGATAKRLMLHSRKISFVHPITRKRVSYEVVPPKDFSDTWKALVGSNLQTI